MKIPRRAFLFGLLPLAFRSESGGPIALPVHQSVLFRPANAEERELGRTLSPGVIAVDEIPPDYRRAAEAFEVWSEPTLSAPSPEFALLLVGEELDAADEARVTGAELQEDLLTVMVSHTSARLSGVKLRRNIRLRPILALPLRLSQGSYQVEVIWQAVERLPDGPRHEASPQLYRAELQVGSSRSRHRK